MYLYFKRNTKQKSEKKICDLKKSAWPFLLKSDCFCHVADANKPAKVNSKVTLAGDSRRTVKTIKNLCGKNYYRQDLEDAAVRRACAILRSQRASTTGVQKKRTRRKRN